MRLEGWIVGLSLAAFAAAAGAAAPPSERLLHRERSLYLNVMVTETADSRCMIFGGRGHRQSCIDLRDRRRLMLPYSQAMFAAFLSNPAPRRVLVIGLGGGMMPSTIHALAPQARIDVVELDPAVLRVAERYFDFRPDARMRVSIDDGRVFVRKQIRSGARYDLVMVDAFDKNYIPEHMLSREFLAQVRGLLAPGGVVATNTFASGPLQRNEIATHQAVYGTLYAVDAGGNRILLSGRDGLLPAATQRRNAAALAARLAPYGVDTGSLARQVRALPPERDARLLTDQYSPANLLIEY